MAALPESPAAERNKEPILAQLRSILGARGTALEIASGTGQHAVWFAAGLPGWTWQPTDAEPEMLPVIAERVAREGLGNVRAPLALDVSRLHWPVTETFDALFCANMLHIAPWHACGAPPRAGRPLDHLWAVPGEGRADGGEQPGLRRQPARA